MTSQFKDSFIYALEDYTTKLFEVPCSSWSEKNLVSGIRQAQASCEAVDKGLLCQLDRLYGLVVSLSLGGVKLIQRGNPPTLPSLGGVLFALIQCVLVSSISFVSQHSLLFHLQAKVYHMEDSKSREKGTTTHFWLPEVDFKPKVPVWINLRN
jgi:hypothetical protein